MWSSSAAIGNPRPAHEQSGPEHAAYQVTAAGGRRTIQTRGMHWCQTWLHSASSQILSTLLAPSLGFC